MIMYNPRMHPMERDLIVALRPIFIGSEFLEEDNTLNIVICCRVFDTMTVEERIKVVYDAISKIEEPEGKPAIIVQAFSEEELDGLLETIL